MKILKKCLTCGAEFIASKMSNKYCCRECERDASRKREAKRKKSVREENYGNGRFVRNLLDHAIMRQADRLIREHQNGTLGKEEACFLTADDFEMIGLKKKPQSRQIGFCAGRTA